MRPLLQHRSRRGSRATALACAAGLLVATAACGGDDLATEPTETVATAEPGGSSAVTSAGGDAAGSDIVVAGIGDLSNFPGLDDGVDARFERANDAGGVRGHRLVNDGVSDAGADAARAQTIAGQYAGQGKVLAVLSASSICRYSPQR